MYGYVTGPLRPRPACPPVRLVLTVRRHVDLVRVSSAICPV
ncbi:putative leader peptide [Catenulispora sp. MAP12-49]